MRWPPRSRRRRPTPAESTAGKLPEVPELVIGPLLRFVSETEATIFVEVDSPCEVNVLGASALTFHVEGHHYALVVLQGLEPGTTYQYEVALDGREVWPETGSEWPAPCLRTLTGDEDVTIVFGSCRVAVPHDRRRDDRVRLMPCGCAARAALHRYE